MYFCLFLPVPINASWIACFVWGLFPNKVIQSLKQLIKEMKCFKGNFYIHFFPFSLPQVHQRHWIFSHMCYSCKVLYSCKGELLPGHLLCAILTFLITKYVFLPRAKPISYMGNMSYNSVLTLNMELASDPAAKGWVPQDYSFNPFPTQITNLDCHLCFWPNSYKSHSSWVPLICGSGS